MLIESATNQALCPKNTPEYPAVKIATPEPALSGGEILRLRLRMTESEGVRDDTRDYRTFLLASEANMPPKQRMAKMMNDVFMLSRKSG
jgi:hypothetical protein